jgi:hypothetical protein
VGHKFHKVYSDIPTVTKDATSQNTGIIQSSHRMRSDRFCRWLNKHGLNFVTLLILILTWLTYLASHIPWVSVTGITVGPNDGGFTINYLLSNSSESPAMNIRAVLSNSKEDESPEKLNYENGILMPQKTDQWSFDVKKNPAFDFYGAIVNGTIPVYFTIWYEDAFHRTYKVKEGFQCTHGVYDEIFYDVTFPKDDW